MASTRPRIQTEPAFQRIRATVNGKPIADSTNVKMVWEIKWYPTYFFPIEDVALDQFVATDQVDRHPTALQLLAHALPQFGLDEREGTLGFKFLQDLHSRGFILGVLEKS